MTRKRVVIAGLGDTGVLAARRLAKHYDVVGISSKPGLVSGQELGIRLARPDDWARDYWIPFARFRALDRVHTVHATITKVNLEARTVSVAGAGGGVRTFGYDALVIATGVTNGFWRRPALQTAADVAEELRSAHERLGKAESVVVVGGGAAAVSSAANVARTWPAKRVELFYPAERALPQHHPRTWRRVEQTLRALGVVLHPGHRAAVPDGFDCDDITAGPVSWSTGQAPTHADAVLWAIGRVRPNTQWLPSELLDDNGFVLVTPELRVPGRPGVFAVGDVAATDELRTSARNGGDRLVAHNVHAELEGGRLRVFRSARRRWGSVLGAQPDGLEVFAPNGRAFRFPAWSVDRVLMPLIVRWGLYGGVREDAGSR